MLEEFAEVPSCLARHGFVYLFTVVKQILFNNDFEVQNKFYRSNFPQKAKVTAKPVETGNSNTKLETALNKYCTLRPVIHHENGAQIKTLAKSVIQNNH